MAPEDPNRKGTVTFFNESKGFGFIQDSVSQESIFVHIKALEEPIGEGDKVSFETEPGLKGPSAIKVKKITK
ncbi:cold shock domain-containing protein [Mucilaginibacter sp. HMF5004]|nr:cold shock domain-containing protein [Mucilaginibacter rivuli]